MTEKEKKILSNIRENLMSDGTDLGDCFVRVAQRKITEMLREDFSKYSLLYERPPYRPLYFPENYSHNTPSTDKSLNECSVSGLVDSSQNSGAQDQCPSVSISGLKKDPTQ
jgi:hypothetical protein